VPHIVLGQKTIRVAVGESFGMMRKIWIEVAGCAIFLGSIVFGVFLMYLLIQGAYRMVTPLATYYCPTDTWIALGLAYYLALFCVAFVVATVGGIAALDLYRSAMTGQLPESPEIETHK